jgi:hypothetical protein
LLTPKDFHEIFAKENDDSYSLNIAFDERIIDSTVISALTEGPFMIPDADERLYEKIAELYDIFRSDAKYREQYIKHIFNCILLQILSAADEIPSVSRDINPIVRESISLMLSDPAADYSLENLAERFGVTGAYFSRLRERLMRTLEEYNVAADEQRILTECAIFSDKVAIDEETVRLRSHIAAFYELASSDEACGRKLDFLVQEMNREANTIGSKCSDAFVARMVVDLKNEIEKIREQVQNIE